MAEDLSKYPKEVKVTCRHCGSDQITHAARYIVRNLLVKSRFHKDHGLIHDEFGSDELLSDTCDTIDFPYDCKGCGEIEMVESDLLIDGQNHPDYVPDEGNEP